MPRRGRPRGTGKPLKAPSQRRSASVTVRLRDAEYDSLCREALKRGTSVVDLIRGRIFSVTQSLTREAPSSHHRS